MIFRSHVLLNMIPLLSVHTRITRSRYIVKSYLPSSSGSYINFPKGHWNNCQDIQDFASPVLKFLTLSLFSKR
jgi:hypothetical protein